MAYTPDPQQQIGNAIQYGLIASVDHANATCTVTLGDLTTADLPWAQANRNRPTLDQPEKGKQYRLSAPPGAHE